MFLVLNNFIKKSIDDKNPMNLTDIFAWVGPLDHNVKLVCIYLK